MPCVQTLAPGVAAMVAKSCGGGGVKLLGWRCPILGGVVRSDLRTKILLDFCRAGGDGTRGCHPFLGGVAEVCAPCPSLSWSWRLSPGESLDSMLGQHIGGVLGVISLLGALCVKTWLGPYCSPPVFAVVMLDPPWRNVHPSSVCPRRWLPGADRVLPSICHFLLSA